MIEFLIGHKVRIHHYSDWQGGAFLSYDDEEFRIPGEAARIIVQSLRRAQTHGPDLVEQALDCAKCKADAGTVWLATGEPTPRALCASCAPD